MKDQDMVAFVSYGNDSVALIQFLHEKGHRMVTCAYSNTGWAAPWWPKRVNAGESLAKRYGYQTVQIDSIGMEALVRKKKGWPNNRYQFCTEHLKIRPALGWLDRIDPDREVTCVIGVRREESSRRAAFPEHTDESERHGGRDLWAPLVRVREDERNALVERAGMEVLPHRSMECYPCVNIRRADIRMLSDERVDQIEQIEQSLGINSKGNPRYMFRPGAIKGRPCGIRQIKEWADSAPGQWDAAQISLCDSGWCGS